ncbi:hypothetical protein LTR09_004326 [Extremus antarcticus]|uniref:Uncharacterized protein n=1 Tax=Extremus antarcticus TaxID=702011 RepID=A0AAJ0DIH7_9PEZI|nr:hypothetical protein LTR09_004326 [Extremus antarcticus]
MTWHLLLGSLLSAGSVVSALVAQPELVGLADIALRDASSVPAGQVTTTINIGTGVVGSPQSTTPTTTTTTPTTTATPTPTGTPHITLDVGSNSFDIGDADANTFLPLWKTVCGADGCPGGSSPGFQFQTADFDHGIQKGSGSFTFSGTAIDNDIDTTNALLGAISAALIASHQCTSVQAKNCPVHEKRDSGGSTNLCGIPFSL